MNKSSFAKKILMPTRHKKPSIIKQLSLSALMSVFLIYLGVSAVSGKYGTRNYEKLLIEIAELKTVNNEKQVEIDSFKKRIALFDPKKLDPDILSERARGLLSMIHKNDRIIIIDEGT